MKYFWMSSPSFIQEPSSSLISWIQFLLLLIKVERWKKQVFLSPSLIQIFLDFCFHFRSSFANHSSNSKFNEASVRPHSWIPGLNLTWAWSNLGSQFTCLVGLSFLLQVILGRDSMRSLFSPSLLALFPHFYWPPFPPQSFLFIVLS